MGIYSIFIFTAQYDAQHTCHPPAVCLNCLCAVGEIKKLGVKNRVCRLVHSSPLCPPFSSTTVGTRRLSSKGEDKDNKKGVPSQRWVRLFKDDAHPTAPHISVSPLHADLYFLFTTKCRVCVCVCVCVYPSRLFFCLAAGGGLRSLLVFAIVKCAKM